MASLSRVERTLARSLLRLARSFDKDPALKALICRNHGAPLPDPLDGLVARFLGGPDLHYYWPPPSGQPAPSVAAAVLDVFRRAPSGESDALEGAFAGVRYLSGLLAVAKRHGMLGQQAAAAALGEQQQGQQQHEASSAPPGLSAAPLAAASDSSSGSSSGEDEANGGGGGGGLAGAVRCDAPACGRLLVAHPALLGVFGRSVVLLCRHSEEGGAYGLILNKPLGTDLLHLHERLAGLLGPGPGAAAAAAAMGGVALGLGGAGGGGVAGEASALLGELEGSDIPADDLQQAVDMLEWRQSLAAAAAASAAAAARPEHDEHGNWIEPAYQEEFDAEDAGDEEDEVDMDYMLTSDDDSSLEGDDDSGVYVGDAVGPSGSAAAAAAAGLAGLLPWGRVPPGFREAGWGRRPAPEDDVPGVFELLSQALRRGGGGTVAMVGPQGQVWSRHMPPSLFDEEGGGSEGEEHEVLLDDDELFIGEPQIEESPEAVNGLLLRCLTPQDRQLLLRQARAARGGEGLASADADADASLAAAEAGVADAEVLGGSGGGDGAAGGGSSSSSDAAAVEPVAAAAQPVSRAARFRAQIEQLVSRATAAVLAQAQQPPKPEQQQPPQPEQQQQQPEQQQQQQQQQQQESSAAPFRASSLFGTGVPSPYGPPRSGITGGEAGEAGGGSGRSAQGAAAATVAQLMDLFKGSQLFRGGPVPGVQVLHQRPRLGGHLVLPPWGPASPAGDGDEAAQALAAAEAAADDAAAAAAAPGGGALEGGLCVGADLTAAPELMESGYLQPSDVRVCMGDAGWIPTQLEGELSRGTWAIVSAAPAALDLFSPLPPPSSAAVAPGEAGQAGGGAAGAEYEQRMWTQLLGAVGAAELARVPRGVWADLMNLEV